jgi:hypothetical protein
MHRAVKDQPFGARAGIHGKKSGFVHQHPAANPHRIINAATVGFVGGRALKSLELIKYIMLPILHLFMPFLNNSV